jgi:hypothetical protein
VERDELRRLKGGAAAQAVPLAADCKHEFVATLTPGVVRCIWCEHAITLVQEQP